MLPPLHSLRRLLSDVDTCNAINVKNLPSFSTLENISVYLLNPTSLAKRDALQLLEADLKANKIDVCMICESWFSKQHSDDDIYIDGYNTFRRDRYKRKGGGICLYVRKEFNCNEYVIKSAEFVNFDSVELLCVKIDYLSLKELYIICGYIPPKPNYDPICFKNVLFACIDTIVSSSNDPVLIVGGDFNQFNTDFLEIDLGLKQIVNEPTHGLNLLDKCFVNI